MKRIWGMGLALALWSAPATAPAPVAANTCVSVAPICAPGMRPACVCDLYYRCSWVCTR